MLRIGKKCVNVSKTDQVGLQGDIWGTRGDQGGPRRIKGAPAGPKVKIRKHQDDPEGDPGAKLVKSVQLSAFLKGSLRGPWKARV